MNYFDVGSDPTESTSVQILPPEKNLDSEVQEEKGHNLSQDAKELIQSVIIAIVLFLIINLFTARVIVEGSSMVPTLEDGDRVIVSRLAYFWGKIDYGDIVVFPYPNYPQDEYVKRVMGLPRDVISVQDQIVYRNDEALYEPYLGEPTRKDFQSSPVPENQVFVMGDNRNYSSDSRSWGTVEESHIIGKVVFIYWPPAHFGTVNIIEK
ncbi:MAG: signal peptidase I [Anaerolineales bacterium]|nr:signal peptidase I [Anaerolineales bacterium]